jgi:hypothetical protein
MHSSFPLEVSEDGTFGNLIIPAGTLPTMKGNELLYLCLRASKSTPFLHQGTFKSLQVHETLAKKEDLQVYRTISREI